MANFGASNRISVLGFEQLENGMKNGRKRSVYLDSQAATPPHMRTKDTFGNPQKSSIEVVYQTMYPMIMLLKIMGMLPMSKVGMGKYGFQLASPIMLYSFLLFAGNIAYIAYMQWDKVKINSSSEGKFEEAAIDYLFITYLIPILVIPVMWYESRRVAACYTLWSEFERLYRRVNAKKLTMELGNKPLAITIAVPVFASGSMAIIHMTMVHYKIIQIIPYCFINTVIFVIGGYWYERIVNIVVAHLRLLFLGPVFQLSVNSNERYLMCTVIATVATNVANDFQRALKNVGPSSKVAEYRSLWLRLTKITRDTGNSLCYTMIFLSLYLFMTITLSIYGLLSQIQAGLGLKDIGLTITAGFTIALLFFICDIGHFASLSVRDNFQKKLLLVELSWMNDDAQQEISMFLRATEMNLTDLSLGGFFDVNRNLFKSLMATMVTYLVVLLQFQISIPDNAEQDDGMANSTMVSIITTVASAKN